MRSKVYNSHLNPFPSSPFVFGPLSNPFSLHFIPKISLYSLLVSQLNVDLLLLSCVLLLLC